jgi:hypothetical protein
MLDVKYQAVVKLFGTTSGKRHTNWIIFVLQTYCLVQATDRLHASLLLLPAKLYEQLNGERQINQHPPSCC